MTYYEGFGVNAEWVSITFVCESCGADNDDADAITDDDHTEATAECEVCGEEYTESLYEDAY